MPSSWDPDTPDTACGKDIFFRAHGLTILGLPSLWKHIKANQTLGFSSRIPHLCLTIASWIGFRHETYHLPFFDRCHCRSSPSGMFLDEVHVNILVHLCHCSRSQRMLKRPQTGVVHPLTGVVHPRTGVAHLPTGVAHPRTGVGKSMNTTIVL